MADTLREGLLRQSVEADCVRALDRHKAEIARLRRLVCECAHPDDFPAYMHDEGCPARPDFEGSK